MPNKHPENLVLAENCRQGQHKSCQELTLIYGDSKYLLLQVHGCDAGETKACDKLIEGVKLDGLIKRCLAQDWEARNEFLSSIHRWVHSYITFRSHDGSSVDDLCQDFYMRRILNSDFRSFETFRWDCSFQSWLKQLIEWFLKDELRRRRPEEEHMVNQPDSDAETEPDAERRLEELNLHQIMRKVLTPEEHQVFTLYIQYDMTYEQIAAHLKMNANTVASHIRRGKGKLTEHFKDLL